MKDNQFGELCVIGMNGCDAFAEQVDYYLRDWRTPPKTPQQKGLLPSEGSANNALPFSMPSRGVFVRPYCNTDSGSCLSRL